MESIKNKLYLKDIDKSFSGVKVLNKVNLTAAKGKKIGICGENGAGKSTLMNILGGVKPKDAGEMYLDGKKYEPSNPSEAKNNGIAFIHQELNLFMNLTVKENLFIDRFPRNNITRFIKSKEIKTRAKEAISMIGENINVDMFVKDLSIGCQQMVEIAKALTQNAEIIIFDEPTTSLSNTEKDTLFEIINKIAADGALVIYISHVLDDIFYLCDEIMVLRDGKVIGQQLAKDLTKEKVIKMMVGRELTKLYPFVEKKPRDVIYKVENLNSGKILKNIDISLREGEIVGLFGLMGAGRSELARAIFGIDKFDSGSITIYDEKMHSVSPSACIKRGIAFITENRREEGLLMTKPIKDNLVLAYLKLLKTRFMSIDKNQENLISDEIIKKLKILTLDKNKQVAVELSGGNQQKVVIGKWLLLKPHIFLLDEPTRGVDVGAKYEIYNYINDLALQNSAIMIISSEMEELMGICDRIVVLSKGEIKGELNRNEFQSELLLKLAIGGEFL